MTTPESKENLTPKLDPAAQPGQPPKPGASEQNPPPPVAISEQNLPDNVSGVSRMSLELPIAERNRVKAYAGDKNVTEKYIILRALTLYFDKVGEREGDKYALQPVDKRDIV